MRLNFPNVLQVAEGLIGLLILDACPPVPSQVVVGARRQDRVLSCVGAAPDFFNHVLRILRL